MTTLSLSNTDLAASPLGTRAVGSASARSDEELAAEARAGSLSCFGELVDRYEGRLLSFVYRRCGSMDDARDSVQEAFLRAWERRETYRVGERFSAWMFTIAARAATDAWRKRERAAVAREARLLLVHEESPAGARSSHDRASPESREGAAVWSIAEQILPSEIVEALWLRYVADLEADQIARVLGRSAVGVRVMLMRARRRIASEMRRRGMAGPDETRADHRAYNSVASDEDQP